jgi:hypothetical protein
MSAILSNLIDALRNELQQYGEMLALLELQHDAVTRQGAEDILRSIATVHAQSGAIQVARELRLSWQRQVAQSLSQPPDITFIHLIPQVPESHRPLVAALVQENNDLLTRVREIAERNHALLQQSLALMQRFLDTLSPEAPPLGRIEEHDTVLMERPEPPIREAIA